MGKGGTAIYLLLIPAIVLVTAECLKISSFNIQVFGRTKLAKTEVVDVLKQVGPPVFRLSYLPEHCSSAAVALRVCLVCWPQPLPHFIS